MSTAAKDPRINNLFTKGSHHRNLSVVTLNQNLFFGKDPTQSTNCHYLVLFNNPVDRQPVTALGTQMYPSRRNLLLQKFDETTERSYAYLLVDLKPTTPDSLRLRTDVLGTGIEKEKYEEEEVEEEDMKGEEEYPDLLACRPCGLVLAPAWGLVDHQIRGCLVDEPPAKRCKREDGVEGTYGYELECYLTDLPATVCCADQLPVRVQNRVQSFVVNTDSCDRERTHWVAFHFPKEGPTEFFDSIGRAPETYHPCFRSLLIPTGPQYKFNTVRVQPEDGETCVLYCVHFVKYRYKNFTLQDIVNEFSARDPKTTEAEFKDIHE
jgi:hypothetical protein